MSEVGNLKLLGDRKVRDGVVDVGLSEEVLAETDDAADAELFGDLPDVADRIPGDL